MRTVVLLFCVVFGPLLLCATVVSVADAADPPRRASTVAARADGGALRDAGAPAPLRVTRAFADGWGYNRLKTDLLELQRDKTLAELARLAEERKALEQRARADYAIDLPAGDTFDERTLDIHRRQAP